MKRHHDHDNSCKEKHLIGANLHIKGLDHYHYGRIWQRAGRHVAGEGTESSISGSAGSKERETHWPALRILRPQSLPQVIHLLQPGHISFNKAIIVPLSMGVTGAIFIQTTTCLFMVLGR